MPLKTSPTAYQRMVAGCLDREGFTRDFGTKPCIDDILCGTRNRKRDRRSRPSYEGLGLSCIEEHDRQLRKLVAILLKYKVSLKAAKCQIFVTRVEFRAHILSPFGRQRDPEKVAPIAKWKWVDKKTPTHLKAFLGFKQWYSIYIRDQAIMAAPLQQALQGFCLTKAQKQQLREKTWNRANEEARKRAETLAKMNETELIAYQREGNQIFWMEEMKRSFAFAIMWSCSSRICPKIGTFLWTPATRPLAECCTRHTARALSGP